MKRKELFPLVAKTPSVVGMGLIALDLVLPASKEERAWLSTGGTCGNVLTILSYLGWKALPVARLNGDPAARHMESDLRRWGVKLDHLRTGPSTHTPIIVERITKRKSGVVTHSFSSRCPVCKSFLPSYQAVRADSLDEVALNLDHPQVFFLDRVSRASIDLAKICAAKGALVLFEPSGVGEPRLFQEAFDLAHIIKYSSERAASFKPMLSGAEPFLEIETLGEKGLRYRSHTPRLRTKGWQVVKAFEVGELRDAAGSGDWCTAGILHRLAQRGADGLLGATKTELHAAFSFGQALAAWNCGFEGARGGMYAVDKKTFRKQVCRIIEGSSLERFVYGYDVVYDTMDHLCQTCSMNKKASSSRKKLLIRRGG